MRKQERANHILKRLEELYPDPAIPLDHDDPYTLLIAVLLSAQCTDERVNKVTPFLFKKAKTPQKMIKLKVKEIEDVIRPCGLAPKKAKAIYELSQILLDKYEGRVPQSLEQLEELPGVGHKTASVVMIQAFNTPAFPVDTHIHRLAQRWGLSSGKNVKVTEESLKKVFPKETWAKLHLQIIYYGREYCSARGCDGTNCPLCRELYPRRRSAVKTQKA
ncbi:MAG: endonuclease III [Bdellovibrionales bacterium]|nr:endonuclease III [Bdellovibrionales bacterium]